MRYLCAFIWTVLLTCFSYGEIVLNFFNQNGIPFNDKILECCSSNIMTLANVGLVTMLLVDRIIINLFIKQNNKNQLIDVILIIDILLAVGITIIAQLIAEHSFVLVSWLNLSHLFIVFILLLFIYKAETLKVKHISSSNDIFLLNKK